MKLKLLPKFILSLGILGALLTVFLSFFSYENSKSYLEDMYAHQVTTGSKSLADTIPLEDVKAILAEGGDQTEAYARVLETLNTVKQDSDITFLSIAVPDEDSITFYVDACVPEMGDDPATQLPYGIDILYVDAANPDDPADLQNYLTAWDLYQQNQGLSEPLVTDNDYGYNYTSVSPILDENGQAIAEVQYILDMQDVRHQMNSFLMTMLGIALAIVVLALVCYIFFVRKVVTTPIEKLAAFTEEITATSDFHHRRIAIKTGDEIEALGDSFNYMMEELENYIENLSRVTAEKERIGAELSVATNIQASMLPSIFPPFPDRTEFDIYATMEPAKEVGGDFYDFFLVDDDHLALVIADVSGKGVPAALFMVIAKTLLKNSAQAGLSPGQVLSRVNDQLCENNDAEMFVTVWLGILEISTGKLTCANAGHEYPAICRAHGAFELLKDKHGFVLAGMEGMRYKEYEVALNRGDTLYVYTDGVPEATDANNVLFGTERMLEALNSLDSHAPGALLPRVKEAIDAFVGEAPQFDDITMLGLHYRGREEVAP